MLNADERNKIKGVIIEFTNNNLNQETINWIITIALIGVSFNEVITIFEGTP